MTRRHNWLAPTRLAETAGFLLEPSPPSVMDPAISPLQAAPTDSHSSGREASANGGETGH